MTYGVLMRVISAHFKPSPLANIHPSIYLAVAVTNNYPVGACMIFERLVSHWHAMSPVLQRTQKARFHIFQTERDASGLSYELKEGSKGHQQQFSIA